MILQNTVISILQIFVGSDVFSTPKLIFYCVWHERTLSVCVCVYVSTSPTAARTGCCVMICTVKIVQLNFQKEQR